MGAKDLSERAAIGLFFGSSTCYTEMAAEKIRDCLGHEQVDLHNVAVEPLMTAQFYAYLIFGIPTWDYGELQEDWEEAWAELDDLDLRDKRVALFGLGDQVGYPEWFLDAMGYLHSKLLERGATAVGYWSKRGYQFEQSQALTADGGHFVGLALDEENEFQLTDQRITDWCAQLKREFPLEG